ncbi:hypothetical protein TYRP_022156 [Tyrophagus putrescentiae]|nr:hypothetical protein TYRP_022156 [Tyrophagus putrescentiae]
MAKTASNVTVLTSSPPNSLNYYLTDFWAEHGDPNSSHYPMMSTFKIPLAIHFTYYFIVLYLGPRLMRDRPPFSLKRVIIPYNLILSLLNAYIFVNYLNLIYTYFVSKYVDMLDTIFFIMRKKSNQVTVCPPRLYGMYFALHSDGYHIFFTYDVLFQSFLYLYLFSSFYLRSYKVASGAKKGTVLNGNNSDGKKID